MDFFKHLKQWAKKITKKCFFRDNGLDIAKMVSPSTLRSKLSGLLLTWICAISGLLRSGCIWGAVHLLSDCSTCVAINKKRSLLHPAKGFQYQAIKQPETTTSSETYSLPSPWPTAFWSPRSLGPWWITGDSLICGNITDSLTDYVLLKNFIFTFIKACYCRDMLSDLRKGKKTYNDVEIDIAAKFKLETFKLNFKLW